MAVIQTEVSLGCSPERLFEFLSQPKNWKQLADPKVGLELVEAPERLTQGARLKLRVQAFGMSQEVEHEVTEFDPPRAFTQQQVRGPFRKWIHYHRLEADGNGGVRLTERVEVEPPSGLLGMVLNENLVREMVQSGLEYRRRRIQELLDEASG